MFSLKNKSKAELIEEIELLRNKIGQFNIKNKKHELTDKSNTKLEVILDESKEKFRTIFDQYIMAIMIIHNDKCQYLNQSFSDISGYTINESLEWESKEWAKLIHPDDRELSLERVTNEHKYHQNISSCYSYRIITKSGEIKWIDLFSKSIIFNNQKVLLITFVDITARKYAEQALQNIAVSFALVRGKELFNKVSEYLADKLNVDYAFIGKLVEEDKVQVVGGFGKGNVLESFDYDLKNTPCENVMGQSLRSYSSGIQKHYPNSKMLIEMNIDGFLGTPLFDSSGAATGVIILMNENPITNSKTAESTLQIFSDRVSAEIERMKVEEEISHSREFLNSVINGIADPIFVKDENYRWIVLNDSLCNMLGSTRNEMLNRSDYDLFPAEQADVFRIHDSKVMSSEKVDFNEEEINGVDGTRIISTIKSSFTNPITGKRNLVGTIRDITEQKQVETALKKSESRLSTLINNLPGMAFQCKNDDHWTIVFASDACKQLTGYVADQLINNKNISFYKLIHPDDKAFVRQQVEGAFCKGDHFELEYRIISADGKEKWVWQRGVQIHSHGDDPNMIEGVVYDITKRKQAENRIKESEEYFKALIENSNDMISILDERGNVIYESISHQRILGYPYGEMVGKNVFEFVHPDDRERISLQFAGFLQKPGETENVHFRFLHKTGTWRFIEGSGRNLLKTSTVKGIVVNYRDITKRVLSEIDLRESEEKFRAIVTNIEEILFMIDTNGIFTLSEGKGLAALDLLPGQLVGQSSFEVYKEYPDIIRGIKKGIKGEKYIDVINIGDVHFNVWYSPHKNSLGNIIGILGMAVNITDKIIAEKNLEDSEKRIRSVIDSTTDSIISINDKGIIIDFNNAAIKMFGFSYNEAVGKHVNLILPERFANDHSERILKANKRKQHKIANMDSIELIGLRKNGDEFPIELSLSSWEIGKAQFSTAIIRDITERQKSENELKLYKDNLEMLVQKRTVEIEEINKQLKFEIEKKIEAEKQVKTALNKEKQVNELKTRFISTVSHEIRTPLTAIKSSAELLKRYEKRLDIQEKDEQLRRIVNSVDYLIILLENVLMINRTDSDKIIFSPKEINLQEFVKEIVDEIELVDNTKHNFLYFFKGRIKNTITDSKLLGITLNNLVNNAVKYSPDKSKIQINVSLNEFITIEVIDEGIGIPEEGKELLFEPFYRAGNAEIYNGSGLGLSIVKRSVELLNGTITVESNLNEGSKFIVKIPIEY